MKTDQRYELKMMTRFYCAAIQIICLFTSICWTQSIGLHPSLNLGFNPYLSPVFGYGLGIPYGAYSPLSPVKNPYLNPSILMGPIHSWAGKLHAKSILKKLGDQFPHYGSPLNLKGKFEAMKQNQLYSTPYGLDYGYGKHYGGALVPNNPYKSSHSDYYHRPAGLELGSKHGLASTSYPLVQEPLASSGQPGELALNSYRTYSIIKPLIKAGALLATVALMDKKGSLKFTDSPLGLKKHLNPAGMILHQSS